MGGDCVLKKIGIKNVRSLENTGMIQLAPITLLVGENSSGKSTFLRTFPLIKQSISKRTDGPILWAGDIDDYVDFGSFKETITKGDINNSMVFTFSFSLKSDNVPMSLYYYLSPLKSENENSSIDIIYSIVIDQKDGKEFVSKVDVSLNEVKIEVFPDSSDEGRDCYKIGDITFLGEETKQERGSEPRTYWEYLNRTTRNFPSIFGFKLPAISHHLKKIKEQFPVKETKKGPNNIEPEAVFYKMGELLCRSIDIEEIPKHFFGESKTLSTNRARNSTESYISDFIKEYKGYPPSKKKQTDGLLSLCFFYYLFPQIDEYIDSYFRRVHYIAPLRATAERYYRLRNLAIDEVDYQGKNLAIFLNSLTGTQLIDFQTWTLEHFGFKTVIASKEGHISVKIALKDNAIEVNLSDTGFGYSQILPIITQLWELTSPKNENRKREESTPLVIAIEQPELHLHPAMQAKLAEVFIASIKRARENGRELQLLLETHSQTIVNYFGVSIARKYIQSDDIVTVLFNKDLKTGSTSVSTSAFDEDGHLINWPLGFLAPGE